MSNGKTPLFYARSVEVLEKLIERGNEYPLETGYYLNAYRSDLNRTVLHFVTCNHRDDYYDNKIGIVRILIEAGADVNTASDSGIAEVLGSSTPLGCAERAGDEDIVRFLKEAGAEE